MQALPITKDLLYDVERLLRRIPFFEKIHQESPAQLQRLINLAEIVEAGPGVAILEKGQPLDSIYFLLKGQCDVFLADEENANVINHIFPGEMFGIIAMVTQKPRSAFIQTNKSPQKHLLFKLHADFFCDQSGYSQLTENMQINFYRFALDNIRWILEQNKMANPQHALVGHLRQLRQAVITKGAEGELQALKMQCQTLADIVQQWTQSQDDSLIDAGLYEEADSELKKNV